MLIFVCKFFFFNYNIKTVVCFYPKYLFHEFFKVHFEIKPNEINLCVYNVKFAENLRRMFLDVCSYSLTASLWNVMNFVFM